MVIPFFSIIIPSYNRANHISAAISSVLNQKFEDFELLIIDDGSTDNTREVVNSFSDERIQYVWQENAERSAARNNGIEHSRGRYICFLDSDDEYFENHLEVFYAAINNSLGQGWYVSGLLKINSNNVGIGHPINVNNKMESVLFIWKYFLQSNAICVKRDLLKDNKFDSRFYIWEDTHLWMRLALKVPFYQVKELTCAQLIHEESTVEVMFGDVDLSKIQNYMDAIDDLFDKHGNEFFNIISKNDKENYQLGKLRMFFNNAIKARNYSVAIKLMKLTWGISKRKRVQFYYFFAFFKKMIKYNLIK